LITHISIDGRDRPRKAMKMAAFLGYCQQVAEWTDVLRLWRS
jgi:hypothetical protein